MSYFEWLINCVCDDIQAISYQKLFSLMFDRSFRWFIKNDVNRASDGVYLRQLYFDETGVDSGKDGPCSILEMFVALAIRCENELMYDPDEGDRTSEWFWIMMDNMGLSNLSDNNFSYEETDEILDDFLDRNYYKDGYGGPFFVDGSTIDMRKTELWYQLNYYLSVNFPI